MMKLYLFDIPNEMSPPIEPILDMHTVGGDIFFIRLQGHCITYKTKY